MRFYPDGDVWFYVEKLGCSEKSEKYAPNHSWKLPTTSFKPKYMCHWRDLEGAKMTEVKREDLDFKDWPKSRIRPQACLGMLYSTGFRFIRLSKAPPAGFKCAPLPVNLAMAKTVKANLSKKKKQEAQEKKKAKEEEEQKAGNKNKNKGAKSGKKSKEP